MRIAHLESSPGWGGQEIRILREAEGMRARGHSIILVVQKKGLLVKHARELGFVVYELSFQKKFWVLTFIKLIKILKHHQIEFVNTHSSLDSWIGGMAARLVRLRLIRTRHLSTQVRKGFNSRLLYGYLADYVVTTCKSILPMLSLQSRKPLSLMRSIPTGVEPTKMQREKRLSWQFRRSLHVEEDEILVGMVCFMRSWKGIDDFLEAANLLRGARKLRFVLIGGGHEAAYREKAAKMNLGNAVQFTGHLEDPIPAIQALDIFTLLSTAHEGVSQAILQAAFLQKPLIATPIGGLMEVCLDGTTGILVPPKSPKCVAEAILRLASDEALRKRLGEAAQVLVQKKFTLHNMLDQMEEVYTSS